MADVSSDLEQGTKFFERKVLYVKYIVTWKGGLSVRKKESVESEISNRLKRGKRLTAYIAPGTFPKRVYITSQSKGTAIHGWISTFKKNRDGESVDTIRRFLPPTAWRDIGEFLPDVPANRIFRSGNWDSPGTKSVDRFDLGCPRTVINLRPTADPECAKVVMLDRPAPRSVEERYDTTQGPVRKWLQQIVKEIQNEIIKFPVLIHCVHGRDRTGVVIAALLLILNVPVDKIIEDFLRTEGAKERMHLIRMSIQGIQEKGVESYFAHYNSGPIDLGEVRRKIMGS